MQLNSKEMNILKTILSSTNYEAFAFGSRIIGNQRKDSDLDLCLKHKDGGAIPLIEMSLLREAFDNSDLPCSVDLVDYYHLNLEFRKAVDQSGVKVN